MRSIATAEIERVPTESADAAVHYVVLGSVLAEPLLLALRRVAEQVASAEFFASTAGGSAAVTSAADEGTSAGGPWSLPS